ncbi:MAG TPA: methyltransferase domain-containing protein, partial [Polyangiaceae bacterium]
MGGRLTASPALSHQMASALDPSPPLDLVAARTLAHYESHAEAFWEGTRDHDVKQNYSALLDALGAVPPLRILDFGCGPGRDLEALRMLGHHATGLDGCKAFVEMARRRSGCEVLQQNFLELRLPLAGFDGIFANASLFHVPLEQLPKVIRELRQALVPFGALFCSNPRSFDVDTTGWQGERYSCILTRETWVELFEGAGFVLERDFLRPPGKPPSEQPWLAMVWRNPL